MPEIASQFSDCTLDIATRIEGIRTVSNRIADALFGILCDKVETMVAGGERLFLFFGGISGAGAMASYAASAHGDHAFLGVVAPILLGHAAAFLGFAFLSARSRAVYWSAVLVLIGLVLFSGDLILRDLTGNRLFAMAAPLGGTLMIGGWLMTALCAFLPSKN
ncbi:DUF423 domain-containing protein [Pseudochrobactrum sp. sp1633]|uniref:DUF423 domain-containing protein n=1 Tax=Pseudochrobactrum sp. sp1633 TaxID=3036706 RepID=UPI0025A60E1C|nr:DUF423 domain-containing protein [Pseudochrobactrum sp. sp1633]MDM8346115.1 DUF423 domain-containing protein [Pseudochrobactrum sp. sp1633]HWD13821.1 DUF423 domain-containing protein [Pseudochrobactrum sp.]